MYQRARPSLVPRKTLFLWVPVSLTPKVRWLRHQADNSCLCSTEIKNAWNYTTTPPYVFFERCFKRTKLIFFPSSLASLFTVIGHLQCQTLFLDVSAISLDMFYCSKYTYYTSNYSGCEKYQTRHGSPNFEFPTNHWSCKTRCHFGT